MPLLRKTSRYRCAANARAAKLSSPLLEQHKQLAILMTRHSLTYACTFTHANTLISYDIALCAACHTSFHHLLNACHIHCCRCFCAFLLPLAPRAYTALPAAHTMLCALRACVYRSAFWRACASTVWPKAKAKHAATAMAAETLAALYKVS